MREYGSGDGSRDLRRTLRRARRLRRGGTLEDALDDAPPGQDTTLADPSLRRR